MAGSDRHLRQSQPKAETRLLHAGPKASAVYIAADSFATYAPMVVRIVRCLQRCLIRSHPLPFTSMNRDVQQGITEQCKTNSLCSCRTSRSKDPTADLQPAAPTVCLPLSLRGALEAETKPRVPSAWPSYQVLDSAQQVPTRHGLQPAMPCDRSAAHCHGPLRGTRQRMHPVAAAQTA